MEEKSKAEQRQTLNLFEYDNFRDYIRDYYTHHKERNKAFSFRFLAKRAGIASENYFKLVIDGKRNLTHKNVRKFAKALTLSEKESIYFENLVFYNQAKNDDERNFYRKNMELSKNYNYGTLLSKDQYEVLSKWYYVTIRELTYLRDFHEDPKWISNKLDREISSAQVKDAIDLLVKTGLLSRKDGRLVPTNPDFITEDSAVSDAIVQYHLEMIEKARKSIKSQARDIRCLNGLTVAVNKDDIPAVKAKITEFRDHINKFLTRQTTYETVYQLNIHFFKLTTDL